MVWRYFGNRCVLERSGWVQFSNNCPITVMLRWDYRGKQADWVLAQLSLDLMLRSNTHAALGLVRRASARFDVRPFCDFARDGVRVTHFARKYRFRQAAPPHPTLEQLLQQLASAQERMRIRLRGSES